MDECAMVNGEHEGEARVYLVWLGLSMRLRITLCDGHSKRLAEALYYKESQT